jgi:hypothetical protein
LGSRSKNHDYSKTSYSLEFFEYFWPVVIWPIFVHPDLISGKVKLGYVHLVQKKVRFFKNPSLAVKMKDW